jgi:hypothetical protein
MASNKVRMVQDLRKSNASGTHGDRRQKRLKTRQAQKAQAIKEQS